MGFARLLKHRVVFSQPLRLLMLEVRREVDGLTVSVLHPSGHEIDLRFEPVKLVGQLGRGTALNGIPLELLRESLTTLPMLEEVDIWHPPSGYRVTPADSVGKFHFKAGERYGITLLGETLLEATVVAE